MRLSARRKEKAGEREQRKVADRMEAALRKVEVQNASHSLSLVAGKRTLQLSYNTIRHELKLADIKGDVIWYVFSRKMIGHQTKLPTHLLAQGH